MKARLLLYAVLLFTSTRLCAQFPVKHYTVDDGLPVNGAWNINEDKQGFLWLGTVDGFCRFDGYNYKIFKNNPADPKSISGNTRHVSFIDQDEQIWIAHNGGISVLNASTEKFDNLLRYDQNPGKDLSNTIIGEKNGKLIWAWLTGKGLICFDRLSKKKIGEYSTPEIIGDKCKKEVIDTRGNIWLVLSPHRLYQFNTITKKFIRILENDPVTCIALEGDELILGTSKPEIIRYSISNGNIRRIGAAPGLSDFFSPSFFFSDVLKTGKGKFLFSSTDGIFSWSLDESVFHRFDFSRNKTENFSYIDCIHIDRSGNLWLGTNGNGLLLAGLNSRRFNILEPHEPNQTIVKSICAVGPAIWVGYFQGGIDLYDSSDHRLIDHADMSNSNLPSNSVYAIYPCNAHAAFLKFIYSSEVGIFDFSTRKFTSLLGAFDKALPGYASKTNEAEFIGKGKNGQLFFNRQRYLLSLDPGNGNHVVLYDSLPGQQFTCCLLDKDDRLWAGTFDGVFVKQQNKWKKIELGPTMLIKCILQNSDGTLWAAGEKGIVVIDQQLKVRASYNEQTGLPNQYVYGLLEDKNGNTWFSHNKGISCFHAHTQTFEHFTKSDGLQSDEFNTGAFFKSTGGVFYFGGIKGVNYFDPCSIKSNPVYPLTSLTDIRINDSRYVIDSVYHALHFLTLPFDSNTISFEFVSKEFTNQEKNAYQYRLTGIDKDWVNAGRNRTARYPNLPPGSYTFEVKSCNNDGLWETNPARLSFRIIPPFYKTGWFYALSALLVLSLLAGSAFAFFRLRLRKQKRLFEVQQKLQEERERISMDLHDNVGTQLSLISNNIQWLAHPLVELSENDKIKRLDEVSDMSKEVIYTLRETIWALSKTEIELDEFSDKLKAFVQKQLSTFSQAELHFTEQIPHPVVLGPSEALHLFRICQEAIANVLKHSDCTSLDISITSAAAGKYNIEVRDNGKGFELSNEAPGSHYGLQNMKHRTEAIGAQFTIQTTLSKGTLIRISKT